MGRTPSLDGEDAIPRWGGPDRSMGPTPSADGEDAFPDGEDAFPDGEDAIPRWGGRRPLMGRTPSPDGEDTIPRWVPRHPPHGSVPRHPPMGKTPPLTATSRPMARPTPNKIKHFSTRPHPRRRPRRRPPAPPAPPAPPPRPRPPPGPAPRAAPGIIAWRPAAESSRSAPRPFRDMGPPERARAAGSPAGARHAVHAASDRVAGRIRPGADRHAWGRALASVVPSPFRMRPVRGALPFGVSSRFPCCLVQRCSARVSMYR